MNQIAAGHAASSVAQDERVAALHLQIAVRALAGDMREGSFSFFLERMKNSSA
jgi:hypothetical protein